jgi:FLVCR family MFS transporter 7
MRSKTLPQEQEHLLSDHDAPSSVRDSYEMEPAASSNGKPGPATEVQDMPQRSGSALNNEDFSVPSEVLAESRGSDHPQQYRVYKRRWFGLFQLVLLNIIVSWDVSLFDLEFQYGKGY